MLIDRSAVIVEFDQSLSAVPSGELQCLHRSRFGSFGAPHPGQL